MHGALATTAAALGGTDIVQWFTANVVPLILLAVGVELLLRQGGKSEKTETGSNVLLGCLVVVGAVCFYGFSNELHSLGLGG